MISHERDLQGINEGEEELFNMPKRKQMITFQEQHNAYCKHRKKERNLKQYQQDGVRLKLQRRC